jgi:hypothetical protein
MSKEIKESRAAKQPNPGVKHPVPPAAKPPEVPAYAAMADNNQRVQLPALVSNNTGAMMSVDELWEFIGGEQVITRQALYLAVQRGEIPSVRLGRRILVLRQAAMQLFAGRRRNTSVEPLTAA